MTEQPELTRPSEDLPKESKKAIITKLVIVPLVIVLVAVGIFLFFGWLTYDHKTAEEFLADIKTASSNKKWQAAFVFAGKLRDKEGIVDSDRLLKEMTAIFQNRSSYDEKVRSYMAIALGNLGNRQAVQALEEAVRTDTGDVPIYSIWALGTLQARESIPLLTEAAQNLDVSIRKAALFVLGSLSDPQTIPTLRRALEDAEIDVRWNSALALARLGDRSGLAFITQLLDRGYFDQFPHMGFQDQSDAIINALRAVALLNESPLAPTVEKLSLQDTSAQVRQVAHQVLAQLRKS